MYTKEPALDIRINHHMLVFSGDFDQVIDRSVQGQS